MQGDHDHLSGQVFHAQRRGFMLVLSSPSGAGKTTLSRRLLIKHPDLTRSVSVTTRKPRPGEKHGEDYYFINQEDFTRKINTHEFYEWAKVFNHYYGTPKSPVKTALDKGRDVVFDIDWQGAQALADSAPEDVVRVFILPPSLELLHDRLIKRAQDTDKVIERRMNGAKAEIKHWGEYDYVLINDDFSQTLEELDLILKAERFKRSRHPWLKGFVGTLMEE